MKTIRQVAILDIIEKQDVETQEELADALHAKSRQASVISKNFFMRKIPPFCSYNVWPPAFLARRKNYSATLVR